MADGNIKQVVDTPESTDGYSANRSAEFAAPPWWSVIEGHSRLLVAVVNLQNSRFTWASDRFRKLVGMADTLPTFSEAALQRITPEDQRRLQERVNRHILAAVLTTRYGRQLLSSRWLHEPLILPIRPIQGDRERFVEFTVSSDHLQLLALEPAIEGALDRCLAEAPEPVAVMQQLNEPNSLLQKVLQRLTSRTYRAQGTILLEGMDITVHEVTQRLTQLLLDRGSILQPRRFKEANLLLKRLFRATDSLILTAEAENATLYLDLDQNDWTHHTLTIESLQEATLFQAAQAGIVLNIHDIANQCPPSCEALLRERGAKSMLVLPLVLKSARLKSSSRLLGMIAVMSDQYDAFDAIDEHHGTALVPALTTAMRQTGHGRFSNIHEAVRWRFEEEAERRSLGLPPEPIAFNHVYPLYGISDIRGSSQGRNTAIQKDLLEQFRLALDVTDAVCRAADMAFVHQFRTDLLERIEELKEGVSVDAEVTLLRYLQENLETNFDFFRTCSPQADAAISAYQAAKAPDHGCVYRARLTYDQTVQTINQCLRDTWQRWQEGMQAVTRHYCDVESTDGIDHMIYAGSAIDENFTDFHLSSLRYEQLRAVCDCARIAFRLKAEHKIEMDITHLVLVQDATVDIIHDETTDRLFEVRGTRDTRYEIVKKRIDKALDAETQARITQPGCLTLVYSTSGEWQEYQKYLRYLQREGWIGADIEQGSVEPLQGVTGLKFARVQVLAV